MIGKRFWGSGVLSIQGITWRIASKCKEALFSDFRPLTYDHRYLTLFVKRFGGSLALQVFGLNIGR